LGLGYVDDCLLLSINWLTGYTYNGTTTPTKDNTFMLQLSLRTLGPDTLSPVGSTF
jgi:LPS-assembly protein